MTRPASWLLIAGALLFTGVLVSHGLPSVLATLATARWGLALVALYHLLPLVIDALAIWVLLEGAAGGAWRTVIAARWAGESANSLMPLGQVAGPVVMVRDLAPRRFALRDAAAAVTVSTTLQGLAQIVFALLGVALLAARAGHGPRSGHVGLSLAIAGAALAVPVAAFYLAQRRGLFSGSMRTLSRLFGKRDWSHLRSRAGAIDAAIEATYRARGRVLASFLASLVGWLAGTGEVYIIMRMIGSPVDLRDSLLLESLGQAIRGAAFAIPGALGVQEGGYLLLAPLVGLSADAALALSLAKRARELLLGLPGLLYLYLTERTRRRRVVLAAPGD